MSDLETVARWLGAEYRAHNDAGQIMRDVSYEWQDAEGDVHTEKQWIYLDPDQELGAILRRARELGLHVSLYDWTDGDGKRAYSFVFEDCESDLDPELDDDAEYSGRDPLPHLAARAAVCKLMEAQK